MPKGKSGNKAGLKSALLSQQTRLRKNEQVKRAAQAAEQKNRVPPKAKGKGRETEKAPQQRIVIPFKPTDKILLIGEGNFTFARALVTHQQSSSSSPLQHLPPQNVTATAYDTEEECYKKYVDAKEVVQVLREMGVQVVFGVDATKLEKCTALKGKRYDKLVWNFPHAGAYTRHP
jgi:25S rRNA (uracil2634-N3)-methyltransferase